MGSGTFGQVVKCENLSTHELVSVKIIKNKLAFRQQSSMEAEILQRVKKKKTLLALPNINHTEYHLRNDRNKKRGWLI